MATDFIDRVRDAAHIEDLAKGMVELAGRGNRLTGCCPFHQEDTPSFVVFADQNSWHCFGCNRGGSVFDLLMAREGIEFWDAAVLLANRYGIPLPDCSEEEKKKHVKEQSVQDLLNKFVESSQKKLAKRPDVLEYLHGQGLTDEAITEYRIGLGVELSKSANQELALASGLLAKSRRTGNLYQPMPGRIVFPIIRAGRVVQISGRAYPDGDIKYMSLPDRDLWPFNSHRMRGGRVFLVEGAKDAILLESAGFEAAATISSQFKREWLRLIGRETDCYVCYDADESEDGKEGAGQAANAKIAEMLFDADHKVYVVELPVPHDPASFLVERGAGEFQELVDGAKGFVDYLIDGIPAGLNGYDLPKKLQCIYAKMAQRPITTHDDYVNRLSSQTRISRVAIKKELRDYLKGAKARDVDESKSEDGPSSRIRRRKTNPILFNPAQDVVGGNLYYTIYLQTEDLAFRPFVVSSDRSCFLLNAENLMTRDFSVDPNAHPSNERRWSIGEDDRYNVYEYLDGKSHVNSRELYQQIKWFFKRYLHLPDPAYYDFLPLWVMATYHFRLYDAFGYLFLSAMKQSGKTQALTIVSWLAFNAWQADVVTEAGLKRMVAANSCTILNDEAERLRKKQDDDQSTIFEVWNGGYKKSGNAICVNKDSMKPERFCTYSPKALANTQGLDSILEDRCITLYFERDTGKIPELMQEEHARRVAEIRNMLYCFNLEHIGDIAETKRTVQRPDGLPGRDWELWQAVMVLAKTLDDHKAEEYSLHDLMRDMAIKKRSYRQSQEEEMNPQSRMLRAVWEYVNNNRNGRHYYQASQLALFIQEEMGWEHKCSPQTLSRFIFDQAHLAKDRRQDRFKYFTADGSRRWFYRLDPDVILERGKKMFGIDLLNENAPDSPADDIDELPERDPFSEE